MLTMSRVAADEPASLTCPSVSRKDFEMSTTDKTLTAKPNVDNGSIVSSARCSLRCWTEALIAKNAKLQRGWRGDEDKQLKRFGLPVSGGYPILDHCRKMREILQGSEVSVQSLPSL